LFVKPISKQGSAALRGDFSWAMEMLPSGMAQGLPTGASILVVDDSRSLRMAVRVALSGAGHAVYEAADGVEGLAALSAGRFDLIVTDLSMPEMDGIEMIRHIRRSPVHGAVPIILLTGASDPASQEAAAKAGANALLLKPFAPDQLIRLVGNVLLEAA
jgi:two-component system, chemotaxis family, chemotaxis protein CheY